MTPNHTRTLAIILIIAVALNPLFSVTTFLSRAENSTTTQERPLEQEILTHANAREEYPKIVTTLTGDSILLKVSFNGLLFSADGKVSSEDCTATGEPGAPVLPAKTFSVLLPPRTTLKEATIVSVEQARQREAFVPVVAAKPAATLQDVNQTAQAPLSLSGLHPTEVLRVNGIHEFRGYRLLSLTVYAAQYDADLQTLTQVNQVKAKLSLTADDSGLTEQLYRGIGSDEAAVRSLVVNPEDSALYAEKLAPAAAPSQTCKYLVITKGDFVAAFQPLIEWKTEKLGSARIATTAEIYSIFTTGDAQTRIRNYIRYAYQNWGTEWVLLGGDTDTVPYRGAYGLVESTGGPIKDTGIPCDLYYADLDGTWNADNDAIYGETTDGVDLYPEVYVGRAPVSTVAEAEIFVSKVLTYEKNPPSGYRAKALLIAYWLDDETNGAIAKENIADNYLTEYTVTRKYESYYRAGISSSSVIDELNSGYGIVNHNSHGNTYETPPLDEFDVDALANGEKYFIFYSTACNTSSFDASSPYDAISEHYILNPNGGAVAYIGNSRYGWYEPGNPGNGPSDLFDSEFFEKLAAGYNRIGEALAMSKIEFIGDSQDYNAPRWIQFSLNLLGDPEMTIKSQEYALNCQTLDWNGNPLGNATILVNSNLYGVTDASGWLNGTSSWTGELKLEAFSQGTKVNETTITLESDTTLMIRCHVWSLQLNVLDAEGEPLTAATVSVVFPNATAAQLSPAAYRVANGTYWFTVTWQNSTVYGNTSITLDVADAALNLTCSVYRIYFGESFKDLNGDPLNPPPSSFTLLFPNGTQSDALNPSSSYLIQNGATKWISIIWNGTEVAPAEAFFDAEDGNPVVYCTVDLAPIPEFHYLPLLFLSLTLLTAYACAALNKNTSKKQ